MEPIVTVAENRTVSFDFPKPDPLSPPLIALDDAQAGYGDRVVLHDLNLRIDMDDRIALLGANGNGKSTFVKLLADRLRPMAGKLRKSSKLKVGYFAQHQQDELNLNRTALAEAQAAMPMATEEKVAQPSGPVRLSPGQGGDEDRRHVGRREGAAPLRADEPGGAAHPAAGRADQPPGRRFAPGPGPGRSTPMTGPSC